MTEIGTFIFSPLRWRDAFTIAGWRYPGEYKFYDIGLVSLLSALVAEKLLGVINVLKYYAVFDTQGKIMGIFTFTRFGKTVELGLGIRPDLMGHGVGLAFIRAGMDYAQELFHPQTYKLEVATFNKRAIKVYERAGFVRKRTYMKQTEHGRVEHFEMTRPA